MDKKLTELPIATGLSDNDLIYIVQGGVSKQIKYSDFTDSDMGDEYGVVQLSPLNIITDPNDPSGVALQIPVVPLVPIWKISSIDYTKSTETIIPIPYATTDYYRVDIIVGDTNNDFIRIEGTESDTVGVPPAIPDNTVEITRLNIFGNSVGDPSPPSSYGYISKSSKQYRKRKLTTIEPSVLFLSAEYTTYSLEAWAGSGIVKGFISPASSNITYDGMDIFIKNNRNIDITLTHDDATAAVPIWFKDGNDFILKQDEIIQLKYNLANNRVEFVGFVGGGVQALKTEDTGAEVTLYQYGNFCNSQTPNLNKTFTYAFTNTVNPVGEQATIYIKTEVGDTDFPSLYGARYVKGSDFYENSEYDMYIWHNGNETRYTFIHLGEEQELELPFTSQTSSRIAIKTSDGSSYKIDWGDGNVETFNSSDVMNVHNYSSSLSGVVKIIHPDLSKIIHFDSSSSNFDVSNILNLTNLKFLKLFGGGYIGDFTNIDELQNLEYLYLIGIGFTGNLSSILNLDANKLNTIVLGGSNMNANFTGLNSFTNLKRIYLRDGAFQLSVNDIKDITSLIDVNLNGSLITGNASLLKTLPLEYLQFLFTDNVSANVGEFSVTSTLETLILVGSDFSGNINSLSSLPDLTELRVESDLVTGDVDNLLMTPKISSLTLLSDLLEWNYTTINKDLATLILSLKANQLPTPTEVDQVFIDLDSSTTSKSGQIRLTGTAFGTPSSTSLSARNSLIAKGRTIQTN